MASDNPPTLTQQQLEAKIVSPAVKAIVVETASSAVMVKKAVAVKTVVKADTVKQVTIVTTSSVIKVHPIASQGVEVIKPVIPPANKPAISTQGIPAPKS